MLLFKVGLLTLINIDSFIFLAKLCPSIPIIWEVIVTGEGGLFGCCADEWVRGPSGAPFYLSPKVLEVSLMYLSSQPRSPHWYQYMAPTLVDNRVFVLGGDQEVLDGSATIEVGWNAISTTGLGAFTKTLCVGYDNEALSFDFIGDSLGTCGALFINPINSLTCRLAKSFLHLLQSPFRIFTFSESLPKVVHFLLAQLRPVGHCFGPMREVIDDSEFS